MAEKLDSFDFNRRPDPKYLWDDKWLDGNVWKLTYGEDFHSAVKNIESHLHDKAEQMKVSIRTQILDEKTIVFQFLK